MFSPRIALATAARALRQLGHDRRTLALVLAVPVLLLFLVYALFDGNQRLFNGIGLVMLGLFPMTIMFLITSIAMLRERTSGTLERLLTTPLHKADLLVGYALAFGLAGTVQACVSVAVARWAFDLQTQGPVGWVLLLATLNAVLGVALGLLASAFASTEFQAVQFMPLVIFPQLLSAGLFAPRERMAGWLEAVSDFFPMTYAVEALQEVGVHPDPTRELWVDAGIVAGVIVLALALGAATLRRRTG